MMIDNKALAKFGAIIGADGGGTGGGTGGGGDDWVVGDGKTRLHITVDSEERKYVAFEIAGYKNRNNQYTTDVCTAVNWGDGSAIEEKGGSSKVTYDHTYSKTGDYIIEIDVAEEYYAYVTFGGASNTSANAFKFSYYRMLKKAEIGNKAKHTTNSFANCVSLEDVFVSDELLSIAEKEFLNCNFLKNVSLPVGMKTINAEAFSGCRTLRHISIPTSVTTIGANAFQSCNCLTDVVIPDGVTSIADSAFYGCQSFVLVKIPKGVSNIASRAFYQCYGVKSYDFTNHEAVPILAATNAFQYIPSDCEIRVPAALYDEWIAATNWSTYADYIVGV